MSKPSQTQQGPFGTARFEDKDQLIRNSNARLGWGSDAVAEMLRRLDVRYIALVPGSSYRGLHDSLVNYLGNRDPKMLVCLHEEHAVAIAHGYAKVTERPMAVARAFRRRPDARHDGDLQHLVHAAAGRDPRRDRPRATPTCGGRGSTGSTPPRIRRR